MNKFNLDYIDSMRGIAILMVLAVHFTMFLSISKIEHLPFNIENILYSCKYGVALFFIVSAYTLFRSLDVRHEDGYKNYFIRRFFRIAPLYYLVLIFLFMLTDGQKYYLEAPENGITFLNLFTHLFFINGFFTSYFNSIIGVEWTIFVEVSFYLILPVLFVFRNKLLKITILFLVVAFTTYLMSKLILLTELEKIQIFFSPLIWFVVFVYGAIIYQYQNSNNLKFIFTSFKNSILVGVLFLFILFSYFNIPSSALVFSFLLGLFFLLNVYNSFVLFNNKILKKIGELSFSIYLIHMPVIVYLKNNGEGIMIFENMYLNYILLSLVTFLIVMLLSLITYKYIEQPSMQMGKKLIKNLKEKN